MTTKTDTTVDPVDEATVQGSVVHTYPDGSQRVGAPPFPKLSPIEEAQGLTEETAPRPMHIPQGRATSGEPAPVDGHGLTADQLERKIEEQLKSDVASGKDPSTPNPTTDSAKPELAGSVPPEAVEQGVSTDVTVEELADIAKGIKVEGATEEQKDAAVVQVAREVKGPVVADGKTTKAKK
ncbi:MAG: hypothetical protein DI563_01970 [Variovorax paradoxus]|uniref:Uncharacterized protein n=1 Tax=Variovorax paradoxus TaxID=34073 RepID=A0A2W5QNN6_VARPD|nr:MAG: hypothetical protein DI563_01970 [Variovorax paradoxus]